MTTVSKRIADPERKGASFSAGFVKGLSVASLAIIGAIPGPRVQTGTVHSDWSAVGGDIEAALARHAGKRAA